MLVRRVASPAELAALPAELDPEEPIQTIRICLLAPLSDPKVLQTCRKNSILNHDKHGKEAAEYIKIPELTKSWRAAWASFPPTMANKVIFDMCLPEPTGDVARDVKWLIREAKHEPPGTEIHGFRLPFMEPIRFVTTMAATMMMRSKKSVVFELAVEPTESNEPRLADMFAKLREDLQGLSPDTGRGERENGSVA